MNRFENTTRTDTLLCGGLLAVAMVWLALSAVQVSPAFVRHPDTTSAAMAASSLGSTITSAAVAPRNS